MEQHFHKHKLENLIVIPKIVTIHYLEFDRFFTYGGERHDFWEMVYADKDSVLVRAEDTELILSEGEVIFHAPNEFHSLSSNKIAPPNVFIITFDCRSKAMRYFKNKRFALPKMLKTHIKTIIQEAKNTFKMDRQDPFISGMTLKAAPVLGGQQIIRLNLEYLLIALLRHESKKENAVVFVHADSFDDVMTDAVIQDLKENLYGEINILNLCERLHFSKSHLYTVFKEKTGRTPKDYYNNLKIDEAKRLLRVGTHTRAELADMLSFTSVPYFCRAFKSRTGMTPGQYIKSVATDSLFL